LALLVHCSVVVDFGHKTPIVTGELVKCMTDCGEGGPTSHQSGQEPPWKGPCRVIIILIVFFGGEEVRDEGKIPWRIILGVSGHLSPIQPLNPFGRALLPIFARHVEVDLSSIFFVSWWGFFEGLFQINHSCWKACSLEVIKGLFEESLLHSMLAFNVPGSFYH